MLRTLEINNCAELPDVQQLEEITRVNFYILNYHVEFSLYNHHTCWTFFVIKLKTILNGIINYFNNKFIPDKTFYESVKTSFMKELKIQLEDVLCNPVVRSVFVVNLFDHKFSFLSSF